MQTSTDTIELTPREQGSWWIKGSRDRYGEAYFIGSDLGLWQNRRPYAANERVGQMPDQDEWTWETVDAVIHG